MKGIIFDWGGVLIEDPEPGIAAYCSSQLRVAERAFREARQEYAPLIFRGEISESEYWQKMCLTLQTDVPATPLIAEALRQSYIAKPGMLSLVQTLRERGHKTALLSNIEKPSIVLFDEQKLEGLFDAVTFSCRYGVAKPDKRIYEITLKGLALNAEETVFIDDRTENITGALKVGLQGILYQNEDQLQQDLLKLGVIV